MSRFTSPFGGEDDDLFDDYDAYVSEHLPAADAFLEGQDLLTGDEHVAFHRLTRDIFEERSVYDMTFNYNLARLNLDTRHPNAGYRYAEEAADPSVLRAEFTPTTPFCPQTHTLTIGSFRAWNGLAERHEYDLVRVRAAPMHHDSGEINEQLADIEAKYRETGDITAPSESGGSAPFQESHEERGSSGGATDAPF